MAETWDSPFDEQAERAAFGALHDLGVKVTCLPDGRGDGCDCNLVTQIVFKALHDAGYAIIKAPQSDRKP